MKFYQYLLEIDAYSETTPTIVDGGGASMTSTDVVDGGGASVIPTEVLDGQGIVSGITTFKLCGNPTFGDGWISCIENPGLVRSEMFDGNKTFGVSKYSYGEIVLNNRADEANGIIQGPLDHFRDYNFDGREVRLYQGEPGMAYEDFTLIYNVTIDHISFDWEQITLTLRSRQAELDIDLDGGTFLGNNALPLGVEGIESDLKGKPKPILIGRVFNASPILCNTSKLIYAVSPATGVDCTYMGSEFKVYDKGIPLTYFGTYSSQSDMEQNAPPPGHYMVWEDGGYFRVGSSPAGNITFDGASRNRAVTGKVANLIKDVLTLAGFIDMIDTVSSDQLASVAPYEAGVYITNKQSVSNVIDMLCSANGAYWYFNINRKMIVAQFTDPADAVAVDYAFDSDDIVEKFKREKIKDTQGGIPIHTLQLNYAQNYTIQTDPAGSTAPGRRAWLKEKWRTMEVKDSSIKTKHPVASVLTIDTTMTRRDGAEAIRRFDLYSVDRDLISYDTPLETFGNASALRPGLCFSIDFNSRFGFAQKKMILVGHTVNHATEEVSLTLWG
jgi:hypothetical protein